MTFPFSAQGINYKKLNITSKNKEDKLVDFTNYEKSTKTVSKKRFNINLTPVQILIIKLGKELEKYPNVSPELRKTFKNDISKIENVQYLNPSYLAASLILLNNFNGEISKKLFDLTNSNTEEVYITLRMILNIKEFKNLVKVKQQILIYCVLINNNKNNSFNSSNNIFDTKFNDFNKEGEGDENDEEYDRKNDIFEEEKKEGDEEEEEEYENEEEENENDGTGDWEE